MRNSVKYFQVGTYFIVILNSLEKCIRFIIFKFYEIKFMYTYVIWFQLTIDQTTRFILHAKHLLNVYCN